MKHHLLALSAAAALMFGGAGSGVKAQPVHIGVTLPVTGPAAALGIGSRDAMSLFPANIAGYEVKFKFLDDASDVTNAVKNAKQFLGEKVDLIVGSPTSPQSLAILEAMAGSQTPLIALAASTRIVSPMDDKRKWVFKMAANEVLMADAVIEHMATKKVKSLGVIAYADAYGETWINEIKPLIAKHDIKLLAVERFNPKDQSVTGQILRVMSGNPEAVLVVGAGTPVVLPHATLVDRGYKGLIYQTHGAAGNDILRVGGKTLNGSYLPTGPSLVWEQLPDSYPTKQVSAKFMPMYEEKFGKSARSIFAAQAYDVFLWLERALPEAAKKAKPGTQEFRIALRDALENMKELPANGGVFNMTPEDHSGLDKRARVIVKIQDGKWVLDEAEK